MDEQGALDESVGAGDGVPAAVEEFLDEEQRRKDSRTFQQEYMCEFVDDGTSLFPRELIERSLRSDLPRLSWI